MQIFVRRMTGKAVALEVAGSDTIVSVKARIQEEVGISVLHQLLFFGQNELEDVKSLGDYNIGIESYLHVLHKSSMVIFVVDETGETIPLEVESSETIYWVKMKLEWKEGIPRSEQRLVFDQQELEDARTLADYKIGRESMLDLFKSMQISVELSTGKTITLKVASSDTIKDMKAKIEAVAGSVASEHKLLFDGELLEDEQCLADYGIQEDSNLQLKQVTKRNRRI